MAFRGDVDESVDAYIDAKAAAWRFAEFVNLVCNTLKG
jgi:hypothetical protein